MDLDSIIQAVALVNAYFKGNVAKTTLWFKVSNPLLGNVRPDDMILRGKEAKLLKFIKAQLDGETP